MELSEDSSLTPRESLLWSTPVLPFSRLSVSGVGPSERYGHTAVLVGHVMWVFGGCDVAGRFFNDLFALDLHRNQWECVTPSDVSADWPVARHFHGAAAVGSLMYIFFGKSNGYMNDVYCFDTVSRKWKKLECGNAPSRRYGHSVVEVNGDILVFGGFDDFGLRCNDMWSFKVSTCEWTPMLHLQSEAPEALHHSAAICQGSMLVWGGMDASSDVHEYRLGSRSWSVVKIRATLTPRPKWGHRLFARAGELYLLGGTDALMGHSSVWKFSYASCQWTLLGESDLLSGRFFFSMVVWGSKVVCFGGKNSHNYAFDDVIVWSYRAEQEEAVSSYRDDFAKMMASAGPDVSGCIKIDCLHEAFFCHDFILRARLPVVLQTKRVAADGETIRALLFLAYTGELSAGLSDQGMLMRLAQLCRELGSPSWMWQCIELELASLVSVENVLSLFKWVISNQKKLEMGRLASACIKLLVGSFEALRSSIKDQLNYEWYNAVKQSWRKANEKK